MSCPAPRPDARAVPDPPAAPHPGTRLNGWKEIATHLGKGVRTGQRWERVYGLPVHRIGEDGFDIEVEYMSSPSLEDRVLIISDPMLATGRSMVLVYKALLRMGKPKALHIVSVIASAEGIEHVKSHLPANTRIWIAAVDEEMTAQAYIVPGLGDAGDLAFGAKL